MLLVLPPSETKAPSPEAGPPVDLEGLSFPELTPLRRRVVAALVATSSHPDAFRRLFVRPSMAADVARNARVLELPARPAAELYTGPLQAGLAALELSDGAAARAMHQVVVASPLWGLVRLHDRIPRYRLHLMAHLVGMESLEPVWRTVLPATLAVAAGPAGVIVDLRSPVYQAMGMPAGSAIEPSSCASSGAGPAGASATSSRNGCAGRRPATSSRQARMLQTRTRWARSSPIDGPSGSKPRSGATGPGR